MIDADLLVLLTDIPGFILPTPKDPAARFINIVEELTPKIQQYAGKLMKIWPQVVW